MAEEVKSALDEKLAADIKVWDVRHRSSVTDFHIVATGTSGPHLKALLNSVQQHMKSIKTPCHRLSGTPDSGWVVLDFVDVVVHLFSEEARIHYDIESLWSTPSTES